MRQATHILFLGRSIRAAVAIPLAILLFTLAAAAATAFETDTLALVNAHRQAQGRAVLPMNATLYRLAKAHSDSMAARNRLSHDGLNERFARSGFSRCVENVAWDHQTPQSLFQGWRRSSRHNTNMLQPNLRQAGIARTGAYVTFFACG